MIEASVIIGAYNQKEILKRTLESLFNQTYPADKYEIVLIDSMSSDGTDAMIEQLKPTCRLNYLRQENQGKVVARNRAIREAKGAVIIFTDADIPVEKNWVAEHLKAQQKYPDTAFAGQTIRLRREDLTDTELPTRFKPFQKINWSYFLTGNLSIPKELIIKAGLFDENFKEYGWEDIELGYRLHKMGIPLRFLPSALNHHLHPVTKEGFLNIMYKMGKSAAVFYHRHPNLQIKLYLGLNPLALAVHSFIRKHQWLLSYIEKKAPTSNFFRYLLEQYYYLTGAKEALAND
ncbi:MAG: glycosyltransferase [Candidatus Margulisbacteria bacterium]|nr:glycosyltransferase [Candidatus Margulisiibacteriota bacterium]